MKLKMTEGSERYGAPAGVYRARFLGSKPDVHPEYGEGLKWEFEITEGPSAGRTRQSPATRRHSSWAPKRPTPRAHHNPRADGVPWASVMSRRGCGPRRRPTTAGRPYRLNSQSCGCVPATSLAIART